MILVLEQLEELVRVIQVQIQQVQEASGNDTEQLEELVEILVIQVQNLVAEEQTHLEVSDTADMGSEAANVSSTQVQELASVEQQVIVVVQQTQQIWVVKLPMYLLHNQELLPLEQVIVVQQTQQI
jgi:hypothetical protein